MAVIWLFLVAAAFTVACNYKSGNFVKPLVALCIACLLLFFRSEPFESLFGITANGRLQFRIFFYLIVVGGVFCWWAEFIDRQGSNEPKDLKAEKAEKAEKEEKKARDEVKESDKRTTQGSGQDAASEGYRGDG